MDENVFWTADVRRQGCTFRMQLHHKVASKIMGIINDVVHMMLLPSKLERNGWIHIMTHAYLA